MVQIPTGISFDQAAAVPIAIATAAIGLYAPKQPRGGAALVAPWREGGRGKYSGQPILIIGGATTCGQAGQSFVEANAHAALLTVYRMFSHSTGENFWLLTYYRYRISPQQ